ncbi:ubiquitin carboxyl-terminal hydrolase 10 isoform X4 [Anabrus simplex]|uniref:ubiquitin carboxyl-terminal hydrolase 10 isoform X4 n=1 Tax=Anabrus simplex TaxID=316456 RepID=UPI0035A36981
MDELFQKIQFLDLTDIDESELNHLQQVLYTVSPSVKLPWEVRTDYPCTSEYGSSPYAVAPLALRGVFLPQPLYSAAPAAVPVGLVPSVTATEPPNGPSPVGLVPAMDSGLECNSSGLVTSQHHHMTAETVYQENVAQVPVMTVPPPVSVPPPAQPVMTSIYNMIPAMPLPNVYVGNVTANVNVQSYVGSHLATYPQQPQVYQAPNESSVPHEMTSPNATRNSSSVRRNRGGKVSNKRAEGGQYVNPRSSASLVHEVLTPTAVMESPPTSAPLQPQNYHMYPVPPIPYHQQTYYTSTAQSPHAGHLSPHPSAQHATGPPLFLQNIYTPHPQPIYSTFPPHQPHLYTNALPAAAVPSTESSTVTGYGVEDLSNDRVIVEEKEIEDLNNIQPTQHVPSYQSDVAEDHLHHNEFLAKYQLEHKAISLQPRGLTNRSNWCYINSTLQALLACPPFYNLMKSLPLPARRSGKSSTPIIDSMCQFVNEFVPLSATSRVNRKEKAQRKDENFEVQAGAAFEPNYIYKMLSNIQSDTFKVEGRQEDAEEFLSCLLNAINDEMLELIKLVEDPSSKSTLSNGDLTNGDAASQSQDDEDEDGWKVMGPKNKGSITRRADFGRTPVSDIFRGELRSRVHRAGDESTDSVQPFFTLQLDIEKAQSVKDALELLVGRDQLEGVTCSKTNQEVEAWQQVTLQELPLVLILHLKWFDYKLDGCSKIVKTVEFPIDLSVDAKLMSSTKNYNRTQKKYKLFAVVYHDGKEATKGHYITDVYHVGYGGWVRYDDSVVKAVQEASMLHPRGSRVPYLLYYRRCDTIGSGAMTPDKSR